MQSRAASLLLVLAACTALPAFAREEDPASAQVDTAMAADLGTTAAGLAAGFGEANPLGVAILPLKFAMRAQIDGIEDEVDRHEARATFAAVQYGAAAANVCTLAAAAPPLAIACFAGAALLGYQHVKATPPANEGYMVAAYRRQLGRDAAECIRTLLPQMQAAAAQGRQFTASLDTCTGHLEGEPVQVAQRAQPAI